MPCRLLRLNQLALHLEGVTDFAPEFISYAVEKVSGSAIIGDHVVLLRALNTTEHRDRIVSVLASPAG